MDISLMQSQPTAMDNKGGYVILDIDSITQPPGKCYSGSPKMTNALCRSGSNRTERWASDKQEAEEETKKVVVKVAPSQVESLKQFLLTNKSSACSTHPLVNSREGHKRFSRLYVLQPRNVLLIFATMSCMGTMILIYFTLTAGGATALYHI